MTDIVTFCFFNLVYFLVVLVLFHPPLLVFGTQGMALCVAFGTIGFTW
jgi:hypothetical protein